MIVDPMLALAAEHANIPKKIYGDTGLAAIEVTGTDAAVFLQGQLTCNIDELSDSHSSIAALCNAKGRVISTLLVVKTPQGFVLILPSELRDTVADKLRRYVLRAKVQLAQDKRLAICGISGRVGPAAGLEPAQTDFSVALSPEPLIKLPAAPRFLWLLPESLAAEKIAKLTEQQDVVRGSLAEWRYRDIDSGLPWFGPEQSEQHIPQMLNLDRLGGISFNKGCYTGQEIVARTHYLGKVKRALFVAEYSGAGLPQPGSTVRDLECGVAGTVLTAAAWAGSTHLLLVLQIVDGMPKNLILDGDNHAQLTLVSAQ
ncbi:YgfZ/GcvT domain-containing protein [Methylomonas koyamae]|nr:folate-binding protein YgfZ [Methylomonas koyamae]